MRISDWSSDVCSSDVAEAAPEELVECGRRLVELVGLDRLGDRHAGAADLADDPAVHGLAAPRRIKGRVGGTAVHLAEAGGVPDLGGEVAVALDAAFGQLDRKSTRLKSSH